MSLPLCETWLEDSIKNDEVAIERYVLVHRDRNRHGGGIGMYIRESLSFSHFLIHPSIEFLLAFGSLPQHFHLEPTSARQGCRGLAQKLYHHSGNKTLLMLVSQLTEDSLHIRNVFRNEDIKLIQENIAFWRKIKQLPVIHPIVVTRVKHLVNKPRVNITCDVECVYFDCCWVVEISWPWATPIESKECFSINGWAYMF